MIKVLFYAEPALLYDVFMPSSQAMRDHLSRFCGEALGRSGRFELKAVVSEIAKAQLEAEGGLGSIELLALPYAELQAVFPHAKSLDALRFSFFRGELEASGERRLSAWMARTLGGWIPDIVLAFPTQTSVLRRVFPAALCLTMENGIFSRMPFMRSLRFEPVDFMNGFLDRYRERIWNYPIGDRERETVTGFRRRLAAELENACPYRQELTAARARFSHLVLAPVPPANPYGEAEWDDQFLWLSGVLSRLPSDIGVIATFHDNLQSQLNSRVLSFLQARHPNLLHFSKPGRVQTSACFFPYVDAVLNCETMTGTQAMLVCPHIVSLDRTYSRWMADCFGLEGLADALSRPAPDRTALVYWYLTHFTVYERRFGDAQWYGDFLAGLLERYRRNGVTFEMMEQLEDFATVAGWILEGFSDSEERRRRKQWKRHHWFRRLARHWGRWLSDLGAALRRWSGERAD